MIKHFFYSSDVQGMEESGKIAVKFELPVKETSTSISPRKARVQLDPGKYSDVRRSPRNQYTLSELLADIKRQTYP